MRIRTIKPEFWGHPVMGRLEGDAQAIAIGLLNLADDEGYFLADPSLIRAALRPFDESSTSIRRALATLSKATWIEVREHPTHGPVGWVVNFTKHQKIDRPSPSKLVKYWQESPFDEHSTSPRRIVDEHSLLEQGTGNREQGTGNEPEADLPEQLRLAWNRLKAKEQPTWLEVSKARRAHALARLKERPLEVWEEIIKRIAASDFCRGTSSKAGGQGWVANPDFLLRPDTAVKVLEGQYDNRGPSKVVDDGPRSPILR